MSKEVIEWRICTVWLWMFVHAPCYPPPTCSAHLKSRLYKFNSRTLNWNMYFESLSVNMPRVLRSLGVRSGTHLSAIAWGTWAAANGVDYPRLTKSYISVCDGETIWQKLKKEKPQDFSTTPVKSSRPMTCDFNFGRVFFSERFMSWAITGIGTCGLCTSV